jgi:hypothetical protein
MNYFLPSCQNINNKASNTMISNDGTVKIFGKLTHDDDDNLIINDGTCGHNTNTCWAAELNKAKPTTYLLESLNCYVGFELTMVYNKIFKCDMDCVTDENIERIETVLNIPMYIPICKVKQHFIYTHHNILKHLLDREMNKQRILLLVGKDKQPILPTDVMAYIWTFM